jgi:hypothetical protein
MPPGLICVWYLRTQDDLKPLEEINHTSDTTSSMTPGDVEDVHYELSLPGQGLMEVRGIDGKW